ncbi:hypothetical protein DRD23_09535 [Salmonella enterica subsp. enterica serovar Enteritidis]|nr:hypothetical protein [Salmonella enterica subsp. enterica serovar Enteritidis]
MKQLVKKIGKIPIKIVNTVAGGNAVDKLKETHNPLLNRALGKISPDSKIMKRMVERYGTPEQRHAFAKERVKTHMARAATVVGGAAVLHRERKKKQGPYYASY